MRLFEQIQYQDVNTETTSLFFSPMKKNQFLLKPLLFLWCLLLVLPESASAQEIAPSRKEMEEMMKEAQEAMKSLSEEDRKMMEEMGVAVPSFNNVPQVTDAGLQTAMEEDGMVIPKKRTDLIAGLPAKLFTDAELPAYIKTTNNSIAAIITPASKELAEKAMAAFKEDPFYGAMIASTANGMWIMGLEEPAVYLMGKAVEALPNADNYNNYSAYLTMLGAGHMAIPVLAKLNSIHRNNSTILNNLGQAWLQLGDADMAEKYLDSAIMVYAFHPQANYTKCLILESKGKTAEAVVALKRSIQHSATKSKTDKLKKLEKNPSRPPKYYIPRSYVSVSFNLGAYTALIPKNYAMTDGGGAEKEWEFFRQQMQAELTGLDAAIRLAEKQAEEETQNIAARAAKYQNVGFPPYYFRAVDRYNNYLSGNFSDYKMQAEGEKWVGYLTEWAKLKQEFSAALDTEEDRFNKELEGGSDRIDNCEEQVAIINKYILSLNTLNQAYNDEKVKQAVTDAYNTYYYRTAIAITDGVALKTVLEIKRSFVQTLIELKHDSYASGCAIPESPEFMKGELPDYDKVNCSTSSTLYVPITGQITIRCNEMITIFNPAFIPVNASWTENFNTGKVVEASVGVTVKAVDIKVGGRFDEAGNLISGNVSVGKNIEGVDVTATGEFDASGFTKGSLGLGIDGSLGLLPESITDAAPVELSLKGELGAGIELGPGGITDFYVKENTTLDMAGSVSADIGEDGNEALGLINEIAKGTGVEIPEPKIAAGVSISANNRMGTNSGYSGGTSGKLSGLANK